MVFHIRDRIVLGELPFLRGIGYVLPAEHSLPLLQGRGAGRFFIPRTWLPIGDREIFAGFFNSPGFCQLVGVTAHKNPVCAFWCLPAIIPNSEAAFIQVKTDLPALARLEMDF